MKYIDYNLHAAWNKKDLDGIVILAKEMITDFNSYQEIIWERYGKNRIHLDYVSQLYHDGGGFRTTTKNYTEKFDRGEIPNTVVSNEYRMFLQNLSRNMINLINFLRHIEVFIHMMELEEENTYYHERDEEMN